MVDHALQLLESPVARMWSDLKRIAAVGDAEDHVKIVLQGENGRLVDLEISGGAAIEEPEFLVWAARSPDAPRSSSPCATSSGGGLGRREADPGTTRAAFGTPEELPWIERTFPAARPVAEHDFHLDLLYATSAGQPFPITLERPWR